MRTIIILFFTAAFCLPASAGIIYVPSNASDNTKAGVEATIEKVKATDMNAFLALTPAKVQEMTGTKMTLGQKIALKMVQKKLSKQLKKGKAIDTKDERQMLRLWIIFALVAIALGILGIFISFFWFLSGLAWLAALIFFILWILAIAD
jgi:magnesium-transporting ATPase (P-type)